MFSVERAETMWKIPEVAEIITLVPGHKKGQLLMPMYTALTDTLCTVQLDLT